jgi:TetR/AcrR family fatty acid metabolism transcriptional regulator
MPATRNAIQQQFAAARRAQILDAATRVFAAKGFARATIKDIAGAAGLAEGTIYIYFTTKNDLLLGILDRLNESEQREEHLAQVRDADLETFFAAYLRHRLAVLRPQTEMLRAVLPELLVNAELRERYFRQLIGPTLVLGEHALQGAVAQGRVRPVEAPLAARAIAGMVLGLLLLELLGDQEMAALWHDAPTALAALLSDGLRPDREETTEDAAGTGGYRTAETRAQAREAPKGREDG